MGLLDTPSGRCRLPGSLGGQLLPVKHYAKADTLMIYLGALPPVDLRAVCLVLAMLTEDAVLLG